MKAGVIGALAFVFLVLAICSSVDLGFTGWHISQDVDGWKSRAQVSMEPADMAAYMTNVRNGMEKWGLTSGNAALIFPTPETDMSLIYRAVNQHIATAESLTSLNRSTDAYANGLDNLRGGIRELDLHAWQDWVNHEGLLLNILCWTCWILFVVFIVWLSFE